MFGTLVSDLQSDVEVVDGKITGTLKYLDTGDLATDWGPGNFLALKFSNIPESATSVKVGLNPSEGSGLVELLGDPDMNGAFKITDPTVQKFNILTSDGSHTERQVFDLSELILNEE